MARLITMKNNLHNFEWIQKQYSINVCFVPDKSIKT